MPIYEFHCEACGRDAEILVRGADWKGEKCPSCGSKRLSKQFSTFAASVSAGAGSGAGQAPSCSGNPGSCGRCGTGVPHSH